MKQLHVNDFSSGTHSHTPLSFLIQMGIEFEVPPSALEHHRKISCSDMIGGPGQISADPEEFAPDSGTRVIVSND
jgi:hypothetical protein